MITRLAHIALLVREYEEAIRFYCDHVGFKVIERTELQDGKEWIRLGLPDQCGAELLLSRAVNDEQRSAIGKQAGGRVFLYFYTADINSEFRRLSARGIEFTEAPRDENYGTVAIFKDLYGNRIDLIQPLPTAAK